MKSIATALLFLYLFIACKNQNSNTIAADTSQTAILPMDSTVTDAGSSLGNYPASEELGIGIYDTIAKAFKGSPNAENVKQLMDTVLRQSNVEISRDNVVRFANDLKIRRNGSKRGVTEIDLLNEMYQHGTSTVLDKRLEAATTVLEKTK